MDVNSWENYRKKWTFSVAIVFFKRRVVWAAWLLFDPSADESAKSNASKLDVNKLQRWFKAKKCMLWHGLAINEKTKCWFPLLVYQPMSGGFWALLQMTHSNILKSHGCSLSLFLATSNQYLLGTRFHACWRPRGFSFRHIRVCKNKNACWFMFEYLCCSEQLLLKLIKHIISAAKHRSSSQWSGAPCAVTLGRRWFRKQTTTKVAISWLVKGENYVQKTRVLFL